MVIPKHRNISHELRIQSVLKTAKKQTTYAKRKVKHLFVSDIVMNYVLYKNILFSDETEGEKRNKT